MRDRPNLLYVFGDQHRQHDLGCSGNQEVRTPTLDALAASGTQFTRCISNTPLCVPARAAMQTGCLGLRHGAVTNDLPIDTRLQGVADVLGAAGYRTCYVGKWHLAGVPRDRGVAPGRERLGFAEWYGHNGTHEYQDATYYDTGGRRLVHRGYEPEGQTDLAADFIRRAADEPWALYLSWGPPHDPYGTAPEEFRAGYDAGSLSLRPNVPERVTDTLDRVLDRQDVAEALAGYYAHITALDHQLARLLQVLEETSQREDTVVVYTSDHGDMLGSQGWTNKQLPFDEAVRVPLIVSCPGLVRTGTTSELIGLVDLPVTLLGLLGLAFDTPPDGMDLSALLTHEGATGLDVCYVTDLVPCHQARWRGGHEWRAVRTSRFTFAMTPQDPSWLLYDDVADPYQMDNLAHVPELAPVRDALRERLLGLVERHDAMVPWQDILRHNGLTDEWNRSQAYFDEPLLSG